MPSFTLSSFNICSSHFQTGRYTEENLALLATHIRQSGADVVCLQEVDRGAARSDRVDMTARLSEAAGLPYHYFIKIRDFQGGEYGTAILSCYPITESATFNYPVRIATQGTSCGYVVLDVEGTPVTLFNTHLSVENEESNTETLCCLGDILALHNRQRGKLLCCGDFNTSPEKVSRFLPWVKLAHNGLHTYADRSIDHILYTGDITVENTYTMDTKSDGATDHDMVICTVTV